MDLDSAHNYECHPDDSRVVYIPESQVLNVASLMGGVGVQAAIIKETKDQKELLYLDIITFSV